MDLPAPTEILSALRVNTADAHRRLEDTVDIPRTVADPARYARLLQTFLGFYRPLEARLLALPGWPGTGLDPAARRKTPWLEADLRALGADPAAVPDCPALPPTQRLTHALGCLYVLEGATLGGRQITAMLEPSAIPATARRFFASYGPETGARWREFLAALENQARATEAAGQEEIVTAARETFACLQGWVVRSSPRHDSPG